MRLVVVVTIIGIFVLALASPALAGTYELPAAQQSGVSGSVDIGA